MLLPRLVNQVKFVNYSLLVTYQRQRVKKVEKIVKIYFSALVEEVTQVHEVAGAGEFDRDEFRQVCSGLRELSY